MYNPQSGKFLNLSPSDGTVDFYFRVNALARSDATYLDYGAGRASWFEDDRIAARRDLRAMQGKFREVIAADVDRAVMDNRSVDRAVMIVNDKTPLPDHSIDVIVADYVIEHVPDPDAFAVEIARLLKPGGWFCARTPHKAHYVALVERAIPNAFEARLLRLAQPTRQEKDVFPKTYRLNTLRAVASAFSGWTNLSYCRRADPAYYGGYPVLYHVADFMHRILPAPLSGNLMIFLQKPSPVEGHP